MKTYLHPKKPRLHIILYGLAFLLGILLTGVLIALHDQAGQSPANERAKQAPIAEERPIAASTPPPAPPPPPDNLAPVITHVSTDQPVVFLTIDDGIHKDPAHLQMMKQHHLKASLFLVDRFTRDNPAFFQGFTSAGSLIENHSSTHYLMPNRSYEEQKEDICKQSDIEQQEYGRRPVLFRPSGGEYNDTTRKAVTACGMKALVTWSAEAKGGVMQYAEGGGLKPGDIVLVHFTPNFAEDLRAFMKAQEEAGLRVELLTDWLDRL